MIFDMTKRVGGGSAYTIAPYNILDGVELYSGFISSSGGVSSAGANTKEKYSPYIDIPAGNDGKFWFTSAFGTNSTNTSGSWWGIGFYDANKTFISRPTVTAATSSIAVPSNAVYARISFRTGGDFVYAVFNTQAEYTQYAALYPLLKNTGASIIL